MSDLNALDLESGQMVGGYTLVSRLGGGAMGSVWRVRDGGGTEYAMKILRDSLNDDADTANSSNTDATYNSVGSANSTMQIRHNPRLNARERLRREAMALQHVRHPGVCSIVDMELDDSLAFIVTELIEGRNLRDDVAANGRYVGQDLERLARKLIEAVAAVHARGIIHRDIKPTNVMISAAGPVLVDFGIAMEAGESHVTRTGLVMGTPGFIAPEVIDGAESNEATDWWSLASVLAFAATGRPVFGTTPMMTVLEREAAGNANLAGLPPHTLAAFRAALSPDPTKRCSSKTLLDSIMADAINPMAEDEGDFGDDTAGPAGLAGSGVGLPFDDAAAREPNPDAADNPRKQWNDNDLKDAEETRALGQADSSTTVLKQPTGGTTRGTQALNLNAPDATNVSGADGFDADSEMTQAFNPDAEATQVFNPDAPDNWDTEATRAFESDNLEHTDNADTELTQAFNPNNPDVSDTELTQAFDPATLSGGTRVMPIGSADLADEQATVAGAPPLAAPGIAGSSNAIHPTHLDNLNNSVYSPHAGTPAYPASPAAQAAQTSDPNASAVEAATLVAVHRSRLLGRARWSLSLLAIPLALLAMAYPLITLFILIAVLWLLETLGLNENAQLDREMRHAGRRTSDSVWRATGLPWHALKGLALTVPRALLATFVGILVPMIIASILGTDRIDLTFTLGSQNLPIPLPAGPTDSTNGILLLVCTALAWLGAVSTSHSKTLRLGAGCLMGSARPTNGNGANSPAAAPIQPAASATPAAATANPHPRRGIVIFAATLALLVLIALTLTATATGIQWTPLLITQ